MKYRLLVLSIVLATVASTSSFAEDDKASIGKLASLNAWVNKMPGATKSLHATGAVIAPTPCHTTAVTRSKSDDSEIIAIAVSIVPPSPGVICAQVISPVHFHYEEKPHAGTQKRMTISTEKDSQTINISPVD